MAFDSNLTRISKLYYEPGIYLDDLLLIDGAIGTKAIEAKDLAASMFNSFPPVHHKNIYRGKYLGNKITASQLASIRNGTFDDLFIGDYWASSSNDNGGFVIADINYWGGCGNTSWKHHLVLLPYSIRAVELLCGSANHQMNTTATNSGGYIGSYQYTNSNSALNLIRTSLNKKFGNILYTHKDYFSNAVQDVYESSGAWYDSTVDLMNEIMVFGSTRITRMSGGNMSIDRTFNPYGQLSLFRLNPSFRDQDCWGWWLRTAFDNSFVAVTGLGSLQTMTATSGSGNGCYIYPIFAIC